MAKHLRSLDSRHRAAVRLKVAGAGPSQIAEQLGVQRRTVYLWFSDPLVKQAVESLTQNIGELLADKLAANAMLGLERLAEIAQRGNDEPLPADLQLTAIKELLDRHPATVRPTADGTRPPESSPPDASPRRPDQPSNCAGTAVGATGSSHPSTGLASRDAGDDGVAQATYARSQGM